MIVDGMNLTNPVICTISRVENITQTLQTPNKGSFLFALLFQALITL